MLIENTVLRANILFQVVECWGLPRNALTLHGVHDLAFEPRGLPSFEDGLAGGGRDTIRLRLTALNIHDLKRHPDLQTLFSGKNR